MLVIAVAFSFVIGVQVDVISILLMLVQTLITLGGISMINCHDIWWYAVRTERLRQYNGTMQKMMLQ